MARGRGSLKERIQGKLFHIHERICEIDQIINHELNKEVHTRINKDVLVFVQYRVSQSLPDIEDAIRQMTNLRKRGPGRPKRQRWSGTAEELGEARSNLSPKKERGK